MWKENLREDKKNIKKSSIRPRKNGIMAFVIMEPVLQDIMVLGNVAVLWLTHITEMGRGFE